MKFLCDRCKTRYSIGDDRVRGKILKIRCKNCANVITVREGMNDVDASDPEGLRKRGPTQAVPLSNPAQSGLNGDHPAPGSAAAPAALEQEWYVSIDGQQEGPFSLSDAQTWVGSKPYDAELHCWSEGFDDWLPVDKVSHFRALRKKPAPPPPVPRAATVPAPPRVNTAQAASVEREPEPKPLFAATMASIERSSPTERPPGFGMPAPIANATPPGGERAMPLAAKNGAPVPAAAPAKSKASPSRLPTFDVNDQPTQLEASSFDEPAAAANDLFAKALGASSSAPATMPLATPSPVNASTLSSLDDDDDDDDDDSDDDLQIGEVSRVVNLADLKPRAKPAEAQPRPAPAAINRTGSMPRIGGSTAAVPRIGGNTAAVPSIDDPDVPMAPLAAPADSMLAVPPQVASSHRRGMLLLIGAAAAVLIGGIVAVVLIVSSGDNGPLGGLGRGDDIDTTRPDDPLRKLDPKVGSGAGSQVATNPTNVIKRPNTGGGTTGQRPQTNVIPKEPDPPVGGDKLGGEEIETMARNNGAGTQRCYMRAQRGAEAILIGDVKKVLATLTIAPDGKVTGVSLDKHADNNFGKCLISTISGWKFRTSPGGTFRLTLQFVST